MTPTLDALRVKIFADGADKAGMLEMARKPYIAGLTTNPTLMRKAGIIDYRAFAREIVSAYVAQPFKWPWYVDLLNITLGVQGVDSARARIARYASAFAADGTRVTENLDFA